MTDSGVDNSVTDSLNLNVLQRCNPDITNIISIASYVVVYTFSASLQTWEKSGIEGTMFVCELAPVKSTDFQFIERYEVMVLNRRGLNNFEIELRSAGDVEADDAFVIVQGNAPGVDGNQGAQSAYGLWIYCEPNTSTAHSRDINARAIQDCARRAEESMRAAEQYSQQSIQHQRAADSRVTAIDQRQWFDNGFDSQNGHSVRSQEVDGRHDGRNAQQTTLLDLFNRETSSQPFPASSLPYQGDFRKPEGRGFAQKPRQPQQGPTQYSVPGDAQWLSQLLRQSQGSSV